MSAAPATAAFRKTRVVCALVAGLISIAVADAQAPRAPVGAPPAQSASPATAASAATVPAAVPAAATAPFLGTWSGVFTTQEHAYWRVEDFVCFPGCAPEVRAFMTALLEDPANDELPVSALFGQASGYAGQHVSDLLTPLGQRIEAANDPFSDPKLRCEPYGFVRQVTNPLPMRIDRDGDTLVMRYEEWSMLRTVFLDGRAHPEMQTPSLLGHSVGRIENGMLVIDTTRINPGWFNIYSSAGHSADIRATERYRIEEDPRRLELELTLDDPAVLTEPLVIVKTWLYTPAVELVQDRCGEMPTKF